MADRLLRIVQGALLLTGLALSLWVASELIQIRYYEMMPVPAADTRPTGTSGTLPSDSGAAALNPIVPLAPVPRGTWLARLEVPSVHMAATVLEGSDDGTLKYAAGHVEYTSLPGFPGNIGIAGHRDTIFRPLKDLKIGEHLTLTTKDRVFDYFVHSTAVVRPEDVWVLDPTKQPTLTLVTCYPFNYIGSAPQRYIVTASLTDSRAR